MKEYRCREIPDTLKDNTVSIKEKNRSRRTAR
jgi:hypothetical protein